MARTLYLDCSSGISGDMTVAALLDLGASEAHLREALATLSVADEFEIAVRRVSKHGLAASDFDVRLDAEHDNHDHDMAWLHPSEHALAAEAADAHCHSHEHAHEHVGEGECCHHHHDAEGAHAHEHCHDHAHGHTHEHSHDHAHEHCHKHAHCHEHAHAHDRHHAHRSLADVTRIINESQLTAHAKQLALAIFGKLAEAEATAHGATPETVHFHEVGATDSIVDICSVAICLDDLGVDELVVTSLAEGHGTVRCAHGMMPVPVPAVVNLCQAAGIALAPAPVTGELVTPTGAAIVAALRTSTALPSPYTSEACGYGAGKRSYEGCSGVLRAQLVRPAASEGAPLGPTTCEPASLSPVTKLECDLDDCTGEALGHVIELLLAAGARDAHAVPVVMKKGRPGYQLEVICDASNTGKLKELIFENTTTIGIRSMEMSRDALARTPGEVSTPFGRIAVKRVVLPSGSVRAYPEYDSVCAACATSGSSFQDVFRAAQAAALSAE